MSELMDRTHPPFPPDHGESLAEPAEFKLLPFDAANFPDNMLVILRSDTTSRIKESMQDFTRLETYDREFREPSTLGDYAWSIIGDLGMTTTEQPTKSFRELFEKVHEKACDRQNFGHIADLLDAYSDHPALSYIDTLDYICPKTTTTVKEIVTLRRSMLLLLDEAS